VINVNLVDDNKIKTQDIVSEKASISTVEEYEVVRPKEISVETVKINPRPEVEMKFKDEARIKMREVEKKIDTEQNRVIINKTMKNDSIKKTKTHQKVGWLKGYVGKVDEGDK
tara:strand:- start:4363 stop:4701 length:339 start_codon:yes stop_codon:yes gene_type:complete